MDELGLETYTELFGFYYGSEGFQGTLVKRYQCPSCEEGPVTHYGGGVYICQGCDYQP